MEIKLEMKNNFLGEKFENRTPIIGCALRLLRSSRKQNKLLPKRTERKS